MPTNKVKVAVLMGGPSREHEVSKKTGKNVMKGLNSDRYEIVPVMVDRSENWDIHPEDLSRLVDVAFVSMHGGFGEDGKVQLELERAGVPYTGSDVHSSALGMNKFLSLRALERAGLNVPLTFHLTRHQWVRHPDRCVSFVTDRLDSDMVVKPNRVGSSLDTKFVEGPEELESCLEDLFETHKDVIVQERIRGREMTCGVLDLGFEETVHPLVPTEIIPNLSHFFDYNSKYKPHGAEEVTPARLPESWLQHLREIAVRAHKALGCSGMSRTDMMIDSGKVYVLEVNTIPGLTDTSLLPQGAKAMGISFPDLLDKIIYSALIRHS